MARIFSISFDYVGVAYNAMVSVRSTPFFTEYSIHVFDEELMQLLPNNKIIATSPNNFRFSDSAAENDAHLMECLIKAVAGHVHALQA